MNTQKAVKTKSMQSLRAEQIAKAFAKQSLLPPDDPIVRSLSQMLKMALGREAWKNKRRAELDALQPSLFPKLINAEPKP